MNALRTEVIASLAFGALSAAAILLIPARHAVTRDDGSPPRVPSRMGVDYILLIAAVIVAAMHAFLLPGLLKVLPGMSWAWTDGIFSFWVTEGPPMAAWCALCFAGRWLVRGGLTNDGRLVWASLIGVAIYGWPVSLMSLFG